MAGYSTSNGHRCMTYRFFLCCVLLIFLVWGCGSDSSEQGTSGSLASASTETGSASFAIQWHTTSAERASTIVKQAMESCESAGVASITCKVYDESQNPIASGGPWNCSDHQGTIEQIPAGSNRMFAVLGSDAAGNVLYQGQSGGTTITPGQVTDAGTIDARPFVPAAPVIGDVYGNQIDLSWNEVLGFGTYRIYRDGVAVADSTSTSYSDTGLTQQTQYCYSISAVDGFGNESTQSGQTCETTTLIYIWYWDGDVDGYGDPSISIQNTSASPPTGYVANNTDCNDEAPTIHPGADEICNGMDDNCAGGIDENLTRATTCGSGACAGNTGTETCTAGVWAGDTCDPFAGAGSEVCDNVDNDCDGSVDENLTRATTCGVGPCAGNTGTETCTAGDWGNDTCNPFAGATDEVCFDGIDNDCTGGIDEDCVVENEDCIAFQPKSVIIYQPSDLIWMVMERNGDMQPLIFDDGEEAQQTRDTIQYYGMNGQCFVGPREDASMEYWLVDGTSPSGAFFSNLYSEDCLSHDPDELYIRQEGNQWLLTDGTEAIKMFPNFEEAQQALETIQYYGFTYHCYVGRPDPPMSYWRR